MLNLLVALHFVILINSNDFLGYLLDQCSGKIGSKLLSSSLIKASWITTTPLKLFIPKNYKMELICYGIIILMMQKHCLHQDAWKTLDALYIGQR